MGGFKSKKFVYRNSLKWRGQKKGLLESTDKQSFEVATPPEFGGHSGIWSPEDLFVASVNSCILTTFLFFAEKEGLELLNYESEAEGILERVVESNGSSSNTRLHFMISQIVVKPKITVQSESLFEKVRNILAKSESNCLISHSIKSQVELIPQLVAGEVQS